MSVTIRLPGKSSLVDHKSIDIDIQLAVRNFTERKAFLSEDIRYCKMFRKYYHTCKL